LWKKLNDEHEVRSEHFSERYAKRTFEKRREVLLKKSEFGFLHIILAHSSSKGELVGYCISTISNEKQGEIDSIYIEPEYRGSGIGDELMKRALSWMDERSVSKRILDVGVGNEDTFAFYSKYDFYPRTIILEQVNE